MMLFFKTHFLNLIKFNTINYLKVWDIQKKLVHEKNCGIIKKDYIIILEHKPVFTLGKNADSSNLLVSSDFLKQKNIDILKIERGGNITFHGPGQIVVYPVIDLLKNRIGVTDYVAAMEKIIIETALECGIKSETKPKRPGVWANNHKIGNIGIALKKGVSYHGFSLNVDMDLTPFSWINPCGIKGVKITSLSEILNKSLDVREVRKTVLLKIEHVFGIKLQTN